MSAETGGDGLPRDPHLASIVPAEPAQLAARILALRKGGHRLIVGISGVPGTGKSTLVREIEHELSTEASVEIVPMDGFHLSNRVLRQLGREDRKGAIDTFDADGYAALLERLRAQTDGVIYAPDFDHGLGEPVAASIPIPETVQIILTEGNYLLAPHSPWPRARAAMDQVWYLDTPDELRIPRLIARHVAAGKSPEAAREWVMRSDEANARLVATTRSSADLVITNR